MTIPIFIAFGIGLLVGVGEFVFGVYDAECRQISACPEVLSNAGWTGVIAGAIAFGFMFRRRSGQMQLPNSNVLRAALLAAALSQILLLALVVTAASKDEPRVLRWSWISAVLFVGSVLAYAYEVRRLRQT